jgi:glucose-1-phosphate adenylyltransferase
MNFREVLEFHIERGSEITVACNTVPLEDTPELGIMGIDKKSRIRKFVEKPKKKSQIADMSVRIDGRARYLASMGIYVFNKEVLTDLLSTNTMADFGKEVIPQAIGPRRAFAFIHRGYWKDIGSIKSFYEETLALTSENPPLNFFDEEWQFFTRSRFLPLSKFEGKTSVKDSIIADGAIITESSISHSVVGLRSRIDSGSNIEDSIIMGNDYYGGDLLPRIGIGRNCHLRRAIVDKNVRMGDNVRILNKKRLRDFENELCVIRNGVIIIPKGTVIPAGTVI